MIMTNIYMRVSHPVWKRGLTFSDYAQPILYDTIQDLIFYDMAIEDGKSINRENEWVPQYELNGVCQELRLEELTLDFWGNIDATL